MRVRVTMRLMPILPPLRLNPSYPPGLLAEVGSSVLHTLLDASDTEIGSYTPFVERFYYPG